MDSFSPRKQPQPPARPTMNSQQVRHNERPMQPYQAQQTVGEPLYRRPLGIAIIVLVLLGLVVGGWLAYQKFGSNSLIKSDKYQAVFLTSGAVYFGKLEMASSDHYRLTEVFYPQVNGQSETEGQQAANGDIQLVKLGTEIHGPSDEMLINREQVLFFENLTDDGKVMQTIEQYGNQAQ